MPIPRFLLLAIAGAGFGNSATAETSPSVGDLAIHARSILKKHCAACHDGNAGARSSLQVLDYAQLTSPRRTLPAFVKSGAPAGSQVVEFIEDGSMPPGNRPKLSTDEAAVVKSWIEQGAREYPKQFDEGFALGRIRADLERANETKRKNYRYFSLHHLLEDDPALTGLFRQREAFRTTLNSVSKRELTALETIDPTETIIRVDLHEIGWDATPFRRIWLGVNGEEKNLKAFDTIFDLMLLEYPLADMPPATRDGERIVDLWLRPFHQIRPIIYVRADWFTRTIQGTPLKSDLRQLAGLTAQGRGFEAPERKAAPVHSAGWPDIAVRLPGKSIPIVPIDAWYAADYAPPEMALKVEITLLNQKRDKTTRFEPGDLLNVTVRSNQDVFLELVLVDAAGSVLPGTTGKAQADVVEPISFPGQPKGLPLGELFGKQRCIVYAAREKFPIVDILQSEDEKVQRYVHPFYELPANIGDPLAFDPSKMARKTAVFEVVKK